MSNNKPRDHIGSIMPTNKNHHKKGANSQNRRIYSPKYFSISPKFKHIKRTPSNVSRPKEIRHLSISNINRKKKLSSNKLKVFSAFLQIFSLDKLYVFDFSSDVYVEDNSFLIGKISIKKTQKYIFFNFNN